MSLDQFRPDWIALRNQTAALAIALAGALIARALRLPMPWLLGPMFATGIAAFLGLPLSVNRWVRAIMMMALGVLLGSAFQVELLHRAAQDLPIILMLVPYTLITTTLIYLLLRAMSPLDRVTAFFSSVPGGVNEMIMMGTERGGSEPALAVHHSIRLFLIVFFVSMTFGFMFGFTRPPAPGISTTISPLSSYAIIVGLAIVGFFGGRLLRLPAVYVLGPMIASAIVHITGLTDVRPDSWLVSTAQLVTGAAIGARFSEFERKELIRAISTSLVISVALILLTFGFVWLIVPFVDRPAAELLLAFSPGGLAEMGLIAMTFGGDPGFVSTSQVCRFFIVVTIAVPLFRLSGYWRHAASRP